MPSDLHNYSPSRRIFQPIEGLRALFNLWIIALHQTSLTTYFFSINSNDQARMSIMQSARWVAVMRGFGAQVDVFFVISGFLLGWKLLSSWPTWFAGPSKKKRDDDGSNDNGNDVAALDLVLEVDVVRRSIRLCVIFFHQLTMLVVRRFLRLWPVIITLLLICYALGDTNAGSMEVALAQLRLPHVLGRQSYLSGWDPYQSVVEQMRKIDVPANPEGGVRGWQNSVVPAQTPLRTVEFGNYTIEYPAIDGMFTSTPTAFFPNWSNAVDLKCSIMLFAAFFLLRIILQRTDRLSYLLLIPVVLIPRMWRFLSAPEETSYLAMGALKSPYFTPPLVQRYYSGRYPLSYFGNTSIHERAENTGGLRIIDAIMLYLHAVILAFGKWVAAGVYYKSGARPATAGAGAAGAVNVIRYHRPASLTETYWALREYLIFHQRMVPFFLGLLAAVALYKEYKKLQFAKNSGVNISAEGKPKRYEGELMAATDDGRSSIAGEMTNAPFALAVAKAAQPSAVSVIASNLYLLLAILMAAQPITLPLLTKPGGGFATDAAGNPALALDLYVSVLMRVTISAGWAYLIYRCLLPKYTYSSLGKVHNVFRLDAMADFLSLPLLQTVGKYSFCMYMLHYKILHEIGFRLLTPHVLDIMFGKEDTVLHFLASFVATYAVSLCVSCVVSKFVEQPAMRVATVCARKLDALIMRSLYT